MILINGIIDVFLLKKIMLQASRKLAICAVAEDTKSNIRTAIDATFIQLMLSSGWLIT